jgi:tetratricopeptide (TPR) repeat protein
MNTGKHENPGSKNLSRVYFTIAAGLLVVMALLWSLDSSIGIILMGAAALFLFLGYLNRPVSLADQHRYKAPHHQRSPDAQPASSFSDLLKEFGKKKPPQQSQTNTSFSGKGVLPYIIFFFASFIFMIVVPLLFSEGDGGEEDPDSFYQRAEEFRGAEQYDSADYYYQKALGEDPENLEILNSYGIGLMARNQYDRAMTVFDQALQIDPDYRYARYNKALIYQNRKNYKQSLSETFVLMDRNPDYYDAMLLAGDSYYFQQRYDSAIYWYEEGYDNGQRSAALCHVMAYIYDQKGDQQKAIHLYQEALSYDSTRVEIYNRLGELFPGQDGEQYRMTARELKSKGY